MIPNIIKPNKQDIFGFSSVLGFICSFVYLIYGIATAGWDFSFTTVVVILALNNIFLAISAFYSMGIYHSSVKELGKIQSLLQKS